MIWNTQSNCLVLPVPLVLALLVGNVAHADLTARGLPARVEVFTIADFPVTRDSNPSRLSSGVIDFHIYELDGIQHIERKLSKGLTADPDRSKQIALQRIQQLDEQTMAAVQNAAVGLAKAMQYGIDRYPAIVFDGKAVVYGLTDLNSALDHYRTWREGTRP